tara:strand:+ start:104 stop:1045 length:942 start_codon:yes stop_codon:yes gene_type:complete
MKNKNDEVDIIELIVSIWSSKNFIIVVTLIFSLTSVLYSLSLTNIYKSSGLLQVNNADDQGGLSSIASQYGGLASLAGISLPSKSSNKSDYAIETIKSRDFLKHLLEFEGIAENLIAAKSFDMSSKKIIYDTNIYNSKLKKWTREPNHLGNVIPSYLEIYSIYQEALNINVDSDSGFLTISFSHLSPIFAKEFIDLVIRELNEVSKINDLKESTLALDFLQNQLLKVQQKDIRSSLNELVESQLKTMMLSNIKKDYLVSFIDRSFVPESKSSPGRAVICILGAFMGMVLSILIVLIRHFTFNRASQTEDQINF